MQDAFNPVEWRRLFSYYPIGLPDMLLNITDWQHETGGGIGGFGEGGRNAFLGDVQDMAQTDKHSFPMRIGDWKTVCVCG